MPPLVGGQGIVPEGAPVSSMFKSKSSRLLQTPPKSTTAVPPGLVKVNVKSLTHECCPTKLTTLTSVMVPFNVTVLPETMVGVPEAEIEIGTFVLAKIPQLDVVKENVAE